MSIWYKQKIHLFLTYKRNWRTETINVIVISEGSCDTEDDKKLNSACDYRNKSHITIY